MKSPNTGVSRIVWVAAVVVIIVIILGGVYVDVLSSRSTTISSSSSSTSVSSSSTSSSSTALSSTSSSGLQNLTIDISSATGTLDPFGVMTPASLWPSSVMYENLFTYNQTSSVPVPWLATGYTSNSNGQIWNLTLRQGVTFTDGTAFNATTVKDCVEDEIIADAQSDALSQFIPGALAYLSSNKDAANISNFVNNDGITIESPYTLQFNLTQPEGAAFLQDIGNNLPTNAISPTALAANGGITPLVGSTWLNTHSAGTGPYVLKSYNPATGGVVFTANPNWWAAKILGAKQQFYQLTLNVVTNPATQELDMRTGQTDFIVLPSSSFFDFANKTTWLSQGKAVSTVKSTTIWGPYISPIFDAFMMNDKVYLSNGSLATVQPFQNQNLVAGLNSAWNESFYVQYSLGGLGASNPGIMVEGQVGYQNYPSPFPYNLTLAKQDITNACSVLGCSPKNPLQITIVGQTDANAESAGALLSSTVNNLDAGIILVYEATSNSAFVSSFLAKSYQILLVEQTGLVPSDPFVSPLTNFGSPKGVFGARDGINNSQIVQLLNQANTMPNITQRAQLYFQIDQDIAASGQYIKIGQFDEVFVTDSRVVINNFNQWQSPAVMPPISAFTIPNASS